jgi:RHS repeat-associated protein
MNTMKKIGLTISALLLFVAAFAIPAMAAGELNVKSAEINGSKIMIVFSEPVSPASLNDNSLYILGDNGRVSREIHLMENNRRLMIRLQTAHHFVLFRPLALVLTPAVQAASGSPLSRGMVKVFNLVELAYGRKKPLLAKKIVPVSGDPRIELEVLDVRVFWHKERFRGKGLKIFDPREKEDWRLMEKSWDDEHGEKERRFGKFEALDHARLHPPVLTVSGVAEGQTVSQGVQVDITASDADNDLRLLRALLDFQEFAPGSTIQVPGDHWLFALAVDAWHLFDHEFIRFTVDSTLPEFVSLTPGADLTTREASLVIQGEVKATTRVTINGAEVPLNDNKFQQSFTLSPGANPFLVVAADNAGHQVTRTFTATYVVDSEPPLVTIASPLNGSFFNTGAIAVAGTVADASAITAVTVNGLPAILSGQSFSLAALALQEGANPIVIEATDEYGNKGRGEIAVTLDTLAPQITVSSPGAGALVNQFPLAVNGKAADANLFSVSLSGVQGQIVGDSFYFEGVALAEGENQLAIEASDRAGNKAQLTHIVNLDSIAPQIQITSPAAGMLLALPSVSVRGTVADTHEVTVKVNDIQAVVSAGGFSAQVPLQQGMNRISVVARDQAGNSASRSVDVSVDSVAPQLSIVAPANDALLNSRAITVSGSLSEAGIVSVTVNGWAAAIAGQSFILAGLELQEGANDIEAVAKDSAGNQGALRISVRVDTQPPTVIAVQPAAGTQQVGVQAKVEVEFSENILPASLAGDAVYLTTTGGERIAGTLALEENRIMFYPAAALPDSAALTVHVNAGVKDMAGNGVSAPYAGIFHTVDLTPPPPPALQSLVERTTLKKVTVSGSSEPGSMILVSGGAAIAETKAAAGGDFTLEVLLALNRLNQLAVTATDAAGNQSLPAQVAVYQDAAAFSIVDAVFANNQLQIVFSRPVRPETVSAASCKVSSLQGVEPGTFSVHAEVVSFQPAADLSSQAFLLEVATGVSDSDGNPLSAPFAKMFNQQGAQTIVQGEVYDDATGLPLADALVRLIAVNGAAPQAPVPTALTTREGQYALLLPGDPCVLRIEKDGYCRNDRSVQVLSGFSATVFDARLAPQPAKEYSLKPEGCAIAAGISTAATAQLTLPPGAVSAESKVRISPIAEQALQGRLPNGWSPLAAIDIWPSGIAFAAPATLFLPAAALRESPAGSSRVLARFDETAFKWMVVAVVSGVDSAVEVAIPASGQYAVLVADTAPVVPPAPVANEALPAVAGGAIPAEVTAMLQFAPTEIVPGQSTTGDLTMIAPASVSSGVAVQARVAENYELLSGAKALFAPFTADLTAYSYAGSQLQVRFHLSPNQDISLEDLKLGAMDSDMIRYAGGMGGVVVGSEGGSVSGEGGAEASFEAGTVSQPLAVSLKKIAPESLVLPVPAGFAFLGAIEFSASGASLNKSVVLSLELEADVVAALPSDAQFILCRLARTGSEYVYLAGQVAVLAGNKIRNFSDSQALVPFGGVRCGGTYVFLRSQSPAGFFKGVVTDRGLQLKDALVSVSGHDLFSLSLAAGEYAQMAFLGNRQVSAINRASNDLGTASGSVGAAGEIKVLDVPILPTGPRVVSVSPANQAATVPLDSKIEVVFSEPVRTATFNSTNFYASAGAVKLAGTYKLSADARLGEFVPAKPFPSDAIIGVTLAIGIQDLAGNPMVQGFSSTFRTKDVLPPTSDLSLIRKYIPENDVCLIKGFPGAIEPNATLRVVNERTGEVVTVAGLSDGSFQDVLIAAKISDTLLVTVIDLAGNEIAVDLGPFVSMDGKSAILDARGGEFISAEPDRLGIKIAAGTFSGPVMVRLEPETDPRNLAVAPADFTRLQALKVDFNGALPAQTYRVSIPAPAGLPADAAFFVAHEVMAFGERKLMIVDTCALNNGRIEVNSPPWPGLMKLESTCLSILATSMSYSLVTGYSPSASAMVAAMDLVYFCEGWSSQRFILPLRAGADFTLTVRDLTTGETLYSGLKTASAVPGQVYELSENLSSDHERPRLLGASGLGVSSFQWSATKFTVGGMTVEPAGTGMCKISGVEKTAAPGGNIRVQRIYYANSEEIVDATVFSADGTGAFSQEVPVRTGDKVVISVEKDNIGLDPRITLQFSENLKEGAGAAVTLKEITSGTIGNTPCFVEVAASKTALTLWPKQSLREDTRYSLAIAGLNDLSGNALNLTMDFRTRKSSSLDLEETGGVFESILHGNYLIMAAGDNGLKIVDVSNPGNLTTKGTYGDFAGVRGVALYQAPDNKTYVLMAGGGSQTYGYLKWIDISDPGHPFQVRSQIISSMVGDPDGSNLPAGYPRRVRVLGDYAFVAVHGAGLTIVDLAKMTSGSNTVSIIGRFAEEWTNDVEVFKDTVTSTVHALLLVDYYGLKMLDVTKPAQIVPEGTYALPSRNHVNGLNVALKYGYLDKDNDGRVGEYEEAGLDLDKDKRFGEDETGDFAFFTLPDSREVYIMDIANRGATFDKVGAFVLGDAGGLGDMFFSGESRKLYVCDISQGVYVLDLKNPIGFGADANHDGVDDRVSAVIQTRVAARYGLVVDERLQMLYVGDVNRGIESVKMGNPQIRIVVKDAAGEYIDVPLLQPFGLETADYSLPPQNIYVMAYLPQAAAATQVQAELWSLNAEGAPLVPWQQGANEVPTRLADPNFFLRLLDPAAAPGDKNYCLYVSDPVRLTVDPRDTQAGFKLLSGDMVQAGLRLGAELTNYLTNDDLEQGTVRKTAIRADLVDSPQPEPANNPSTGNGEASFSAPGLLDVPAASGVYLHSGEFFTAETDLRLPGRGFDFVFTRKYEAQGIYSGPLGWNWDHAYNRRLLELPSGDILYFNGLGRRERYVAVKYGDAVSGYTSPAGALTELKKRMDGTFTLIFPDRFIEIYDPQGRLSRLQDRNANKMEFYYDFGGNLSAVQDTMGRLIVFEYYPVLIAADWTVTPESGRLKSISDFAGRKVTYEYDLHGDLVKAVLGEGEEQQNPRSKSYTYSTQENPTDLKLGHNLKSVTDPQGQIYLSLLTYNGDDRLTSEKIGEASITVSSGLSATTIDGNSVSRTYGHNSAGNPLAVTEGGKQTTFAYNAGGLVNSVTYPDGNFTQYSYDAGNAEKLSRGNLLVMTENPGIKGADEASRVTTFTYDNYANQVKTMALPNSLSASHTLDGNGNITAVQTNMPGVNFTYEYNAYGQLSAETDAMQNRTAYVYHPEAAPGGNASSASGRTLDPATGGYLKQAASAMSSKQFEQYSGAGNLSKFSDNSGVSASYNLDAFNQVQSESINAAGSLSPMQLSSTHGYDNNGNETSKTENWGVVSNSFTSTYDNRNNLKTFSQTGLGTTKYNYDNNDNVTAIDDASGRSTTFAYNSRNLISGLTSGAGAGAGTSQFDYDGNGNLTQITDARGKTTIMAYDGYDRVKSVLDPLGNQTLISRAQFGNLLTIKRLNSSGTLLRQSTTLNDPLGRMASRSDKLLETSEDIAYVYGYSNLPDGGQEITITDPLGRVSKVSKDKEGKVFQEEDAAGNLVEYYYEDGRGNMTRKLEKEKAADGTFAEYTTKYEYNAFNKVEKLTENLGTPQEALTTFLYDERGSLSGSIDAEGHKIYHEYDLFGRKTKTTRELESGERLIMQFAYDAGNNLVSIKDANDNETRYEYDTIFKRNWLTKVIYPDSTFIEYTYDLNGNVLTEKQRNGTVVTNTYNDLNLLTHRTVQPAAGVLDTTAETYEYDGVSRLTKATDNDSTVIFGYDSLNRRTSENQNGKLIQYTYDKVNNLTSIQYPNQRIIEREFDVLNRINKIKQGGTDIANMEFIGRTYRMLSKGYQNGDVVKYLYDQGRRMTGIDAKNLNQQIINQYAYGYNKVNLKNYEQRLHDASKGDVYAYDAINRIKNIKFDAADPTDPLTAQFAKAKTYNLDKVDNILKIVENKNSVDTEIVTEMTGNNAQLNQYSKFDQWNMAYDQNGNTTQKGSQQFSYNFRNQLVRSVDGGSTITLKYDPLGRRIEKAGPAGTMRFYYAGNQIIEERNGSDQVTKQYIYGNGIDELFRLDVYSDAASTPYYVHTNDIGSTTAITNGNGALVERVGYDTFGLPSFTNASGQPIASSSIGNNILFQGREYDPELNHYNYRARYYDPIMGRFLQTDPVGYQDSMNLYQGMNMNPGNYVDPLGLYDIDFHYYVIYYVMRAKGWAHEKANTIASFSQYVDNDSITDWIATDLAKVNFFHFPGANENGKTVKRWGKLTKHLQIAASEYSKNQDRYNSILVGALLHSFADSWAHEGFDAKRGGHAFLGYEPDIISKSPESIDKAIDAAKNIYNILPEGQESALCWNEVEKDLRYAFNINNNPKEKEKLANTYGDFLSGPIFWVIEGMNSITEKRFGGSSNYDLQSISKLREDFIKTLSIFGLFK